MYTVYKHTNIQNGKVYIGITRQRPERRWQNGAGYVDNDYFYKAIKKNGWNGFEHEILFEGLTKQQACAKEIELIAEYKSNSREYGYNISIGGESFDVAPRFGKDNPKSSAVNCFDSKHNYIRSFQCQSEAAAILGINRKGITKCCLGETKTYKGYIFEYADKFYVKPIRSERGRHNNHKKTAINLIDEEGNVLKTFKSIKDALVEYPNDKSEGISRCCSGYLKSYHERRWCYAD